MLKPFRQTTQRWLINPLVPVEDSLHGRLTLLTTILLFVIVAGGISSVAYFALSASHGVAQEGAIFNLVAVLFMIVCYGFARIGQYNTAAWGTIGVTVAGVAAISVAAPDNFPVLSYLVVPIVMGGVLFSVNTMVLLAGLSTVIMIALPLVFDVDIYSILDGPLPLVLSVTAVLTLGLVILRQREIDLKFSTIVHAMDELIIVHRAGRILYINPAGLKVIGAKSPHEIIGKSFSDFVPDGAMDNGGTAEIFRFGQDFTMRTYERLHRLDGQVVEMDMMMDRITFNGQPAIQILGKTRERRLNNALEVVYSHFVENADDMVMIHDEQGDLIYVNPAAQAFSGYTMDEVRDVRLERVLLEPLPTGKANNGKHITETYAPGTTLDLRTRSGEIRQVDVVTYMRQDNHALVALREHVSYDTQTRQIETHFARLFNTDAFGATITRLTDNIMLNVNDAFLEMLEYSREEVIGKRIEDIGLYESLEDRARIIARLKEEGSTPATEVRFVTRSGEVRNVLISMEAIEIAETPCLVAVLQDITVHRGIEENLVESETRYRLVSELMSDYAYSWRVHPDEEINLQVEWVTDAFEQITGYTSQEVQQMRGWMLIHPDDIPLRKRTVRALLNGESKVSEFRIITKGGQVRWIRDYARPVWNEDSTAVMHIYGAVRDITEQVESEKAAHIQALQQAIVAELGQRALENPTQPDILLNDAVMLVAQVLNVPHAAILMLDEDGQQLEVRAGVGWAKSMLSTQITLDAPYQEAQTIKTGETIIVESYDDDAPNRKSPLLAQTDVNSAITVLIQGHMPVLGVLGVYAPTYQRFSQDDHNFLQSVANVIASYLDQRNISEAEARQRTLAEALRDTAAILNSTLNVDTVIERMLDHVARVVPHDAASLMLVEDDHVRLIKYRAQDGKPQSNLDNLSFSINDAPNILQMIETGEPVMISDTLLDSGWQTFAEQTRWIRAYIGAPIYFQGDLLGILNLDSGKPNNFTPADMHRLQAFANQAAIAIYNARRATQLEQRVAERTAQLDLEHRRTQAILDSTGDGIFYTEGLTIRYVNRAFCEMMGYSMEELTGQSTALLIAEGMTSENADSWQEIQTALRQGAVIRAERTLKRRDGRTFQAALTISLAGDSDAVSDKLTTVTLVRDVSQEKRLASQKSRFIANASHELRSPMSSLKLHLYMLRRQPERSDYHISLLERITERMNILVEDLLDISRIEQGVIQLRRRSAILQDLVNNVLEIMRANAQNKGITLTHEFDTEPLHIFADPERVDQVITNLVANAINYTLQGGSIRVEVSKDYDDMADRHMARVEVRDTGIGISVDDQPHVFEAFYRADTESEGTGLGLNIAREIILLHDGDITLESTPGEGSTFIICLPLSNV